MTTATRQSRRRMIMKGAKLARKRIAHMAAAAELKSLRDNRRPWQLPTKHPGKLLSARRSYSKTRGEMNRSIIRDVREVEPAITAKIGRRIVELVPQRVYDRMFHATKGPRSRRVFA